MTGTTAWAIRDIEGPAGRLEALLDEPNTPRAAVVLAHPHPQHGGTMHNKVIYRAAKALKGIDCAVLRFNFRGVGSSEGSWDEGQGEMDDFRGGIDWVANRYPGVSVWAAGFSFGAWIALTVGALDPRVDLLLGIGAPTTCDLATFRASTKPKFLIHGEGDELFPLQDVWRLYAELEEPKELAVIENADHLFDGRVSEVGSTIGELLGDFEK